MKDIKSISKELWTIVVRLYFLLFQLGKQIVLPNRKRKGNLLNTLFLLYIGIIENIQHFEHRQFKLTDVLQKKFVRRGLMLLSFLLFLLTSFEQPLTTPSPVNESANIQCSYHQESKESVYNSIVEVIGISGEFLRVAAAKQVFASCLAPGRIPTKLYIDNRRLLI